LRLAFLFDSSIIHTYNMGRGDIRTKKGKTFAGSFGKSRPAKSAESVKAAAAAKKAAEKKGK
jgi:30S ribosomal protein S31